MEKCQGYIWSYYTWKKKLKSPFWKNFLDPYILIYQRITCANDQHRSPTHFGSLSHVRISAYSVFLIHATYTLIGHYLWVQDIFSRGHFDYFFQVKHNPTCPSTVKFKLSLIKSQNYWLFYSLIYKLFKFSLLNCKWAKSKNLCQSSRLPIPFPLMYATQIQCNIF